MSDSTKWIVSIIVSMLFGGTAGAFINQYYENRETIIGYSLSTTSLGAAEATKSVLPGLKLVLGDSEIPAVYTHTVELAHSSGPEAESARVGIQIRNGALLGKVLAEGPSAVHTIDCGDFDARSNSLICNVGRVSSNNRPYKIVLATDREVKLALFIDGRHMRVEDVSERSKAAGNKWGMLGVFLLASLMTAVMVQIVNSLSISIRK